MSAPEPGTTSKWDHVGPVTEGDLVPLPPAYDGITFKERLIRYNIEVANHAKRKKLALQSCHAKVDEFARCTADHGFAGVWRCKQLNAGMNKCISEEVARLKGDEPEVSGAPK